MKIDEVTIRQNISELKSYEVGRKGKYLRNYRMYCNTTKEKHDSW